MHGEIIGIVHREGHCGTKKTRELVEKCYYIQNIQDKVERFVKSCGECLIIDSKRGKKEGFSTPIDKVQEPLGTYHVDHVGPLTETKKKYNHILAVVDGFSKFVWLYPTRSTGTDDVLNRLEKQSALFRKPSAHRYR